MNMIDENVRDRNYSYVKRRGAFKNVHIQIHGLYVTMLRYRIFIDDWLFSERELKFMFAICHRRSVCLSVVCRLSVTFVRPTQAIEIFGNVSTPFGTLAIYDLSVKILRRSSQGNPSVGGVKHKRGSRIQRFWTYPMLYLGNGARQELSYY